MMVEIFSLNWRWSKQCFVLEFGNDLSEKFASKGHGKKNPTPTKLKILLIIID